MDKQVTCMGFDLILTSHGVEIVCVIYTSSPSLYASNPLQE